MFTYIIQYWKCRLKHNMCWLPGRYSPTVCGVHIFNRYSQRPLLMGWKLKENTATPNDEHSNQRQQLIHRLKTCPFQGCLLPFQSSVSKASSTSNPKVSKIEAAPLGATQWKKIIWKNENECSYFPFYNKDPCVSNGRNVPTRCRGRVGGVKKRGLGTEIKTTHLWFSISFPG